MISGIYAILNLSNNKYYIGSAIDLKIRWRNHINELNRNKHANSYLQNAWNKYGNLDFIFVIIEIIENKIILIEREIFWIKTLNSIERSIGYNIYWAGSTALGMKRSEATKLKMSISRRKRPPHSEETKRKISATSKETRQNLRRFDKWPHENGWKCKCAECFAKRKSKQVEYYQNRKAVNVQ